MKTLFSCIAMLCLSCSLFAQSADDEKAIRQVIQTLSEGWTKGSGEQFASVFSDNHDFIVWNGFYSKNMSPEENAQGHQRIFDSIYRGTQLHYVVDKIRFIRNDIALVHVFGAVNPKTEARPKDPQVLWTSLLEKTDGQWKILSFHNLDLEMFEDENTRKSAPVGPEIMYAGWYADQK